MPRPRIDEKNVEFELFTPHTRQLEVIQALEDPTVKYVILIAGRQTGKTALAMNQVIMWAINDPGSLIYWVSPTDAQMQSVYKAIIDAIYEAKIIKSKRGAKGDTEIRFKNGSTILFRAAGSEDSLRGTSGVSYLVLDEAAFIKKDTVEVVILPMLSTRIKKVFYISTPKGKNWLYDTFNRYSKKHNCRTFKFSTLDNPYVDMDFIQHEKETLSEALYQQEILAEWIDSSSVFNNISECLCLKEQDYPKAGENYYAGIDIGLETDATVMSIINNAGDLVKQYRWHRNNSAQLLKNIEKVNADWKPRKIYIENNNQGLVFYQMLKPKMQNLQDINTSSANKPEMINDLIFLFNTKGMKLCDNKQLRIELEGFLVSQTPTGKAKFAAAHNMSDDCVMSLAIARYCWKIHQKANNYIGFF